MISARCRKNIKRLTKAERDLLRDALFRLHELGRYDKYVTMHGFVANLGHSGPAFLAWHRVFVKSLEDELRGLAPEFSQVTIPYWNPAEDGIADDGTPIWQPGFLGGPGTDDAQGKVELKWTGLDGQQKTWLINRNPLDPSAVPVDSAVVDDILDEDDYDLNTGEQFRPRLEFGPHGAAHVFLGIRNMGGGPVGDQSDFATAVNDPFFFFIHANVDRYWARWQERKRAKWLAANPGSAYPATQLATDYYWNGSDAAHNWAPPPAGSGPVNAPLPVRHNLDSVMWPWDGSQTPLGGAASAILPWTVVPETYRPQGQLDHRALGYVYDDDPPRVDLESPSLVFLDVPEGEQAARAVVLRVTSCHPATFEVSAGPSVTSGAPGSAFTLPPAPVGPPVVTAPLAGSATAHAYVWVLYEGTTDGDTATGEVTVRCVETGEEWTVPITANTKARESAAVVMALDRSASMGFDSGIPGKKRIDVLHFAAPPFVDAIHEGNAMGVVAFDHDADVVTAVLGPLGAPGPFDTQRAQLKSAIASHAHNPLGNTAIGDGLEASHGLLEPLDSTDYPVKATIVLTDGQETASKRIVDVQGILNERVYAIGLGTPDELEPADLMAVANGSGGYMLFTGALDEDALFRLSKFYLQILAGVTNEQIVSDPEGYVGKGQQHTIPFVLNEADRTATVYLLTPAPEVVRVALEAPDGTVIHSGTAATTPGVSFVQGTNLAYYRLVLPVAGSSGEVHGGVWRAHVWLDVKYLDSYLRDLSEAEQKALLLHGARYCLSVHSYSNLRMGATLVQSSYEPGARLLLRSVLTESQLPLAHRSQVTAEVERPDGSTTTVSLAEVEPGIYQASVDALLPGVYRARLLAAGTSLRNRPFTRESLLTGAIWKGGDDPGRKPGEGGEEGGKGDSSLCCLLDCLLKEPSVLRFLDGKGIDAAGLRRCVQRCCEDDRSGGADPAAHGSTAELLAKLGQPSLREAIEALAERLRGAR